MCHRLPGGRAWAEGRYRRSGHDPLEPSVASTEPETLWSVPHTHEEVEAQGRCLTRWATWRARGKARGQAVHPREGARALAGGWGCWLAVGLVTQREGDEGQGREDRSCLTLSRNSLSKQ